MSARSTAALVALAALTASAHAHWTVTVLESSQSNSFPRMYAIWGDRQGGSTDAGLQLPKQWNGTAASGFLLPMPPGGNGAKVAGMSATDSVGEGYISVTPESGYSALFRWNAAGTAVTVIGPPPGFDASYGRGTSGLQQVGEVETFSTGNSAPALWFGSTDSFVNLLPPGFVRGRAYGTDGTRQVGELSDPSTDEDIAALWTGTAASFVSLHPGGRWIGSVGRGASQGRQAGYVYDNDTEHAVAWQGSAASMIDLHPDFVPGISSSQALGISGTVICGGIRVPGPTHNVDRAALWTSLSPTAFVNLHDFLPPGYEESEAIAVWTDGNGIIRVVGNARDFDTFSDDAILWTFNSCALPITLPASNEALANDRDGDMLRDSCTALDSSNDCNNNGQIDSAETLVFTNELFLLGPGSWAVNGSANAGGGIAQLTPASFNQQGSIVRPSLTAGPTQRLRAIFDFRVSFNNPVPADGFSFSLLPADLFTTSANFGEDGVNAPGVITVKFNTYENAPIEGSNSVFIRYNGVNVSGNLSLPFTIADGVWHRAVIDLTPEGRVSVRLGTNPGDMVSVLNNVQLPGYSPTRHLIGFGARTGGAYSRHEIAGVRLGVNGPNDIGGNGRPDACDCPADFNRDGTADFFDYLDFVAAFDAETPDADFNGDNSIDFFDYLDFVAAFDQGCPG